MKDNPDLKFEVGDRMKFVLRNGKIEEGVVRAIIQTTGGPVLNVSFGPKGDLAASVNVRQVRNLYATKYSVDLRISFLDHIK
jgi:hypothetical protein